MTSPESSLTVGLAADLKLIADEAVCICVATCNEQIIASIDLREVTVLSLVWKAHHMRHSSKLSREALRELAPHRLGAFCLDKKRTGTVNPRRSSQGYWLQIRQAQLAPYLGSRNSSEA